MVHEVQADPATIAELTARFGEAVAPGGDLDRQALAAAAFADEDGRIWLEQLIWPKVGVRLAAWIGSLDSLQPRPRAGVVEVPLLFESGMDKAFDVTICVLADEAVRSARAAGRGHAALDERAARQLSQAEKAERSDFVVVNDGSTAELELALSEVADSIAV